MYRKLDDFLNHWKSESESTARVLEQLTDDNLERSVCDGHRTLGRMAWHLAVTIPEMMGQTGPKNRWSLKRRMVRSQPARARDIARTR